MKRFLFLGTAFLFCLFSAFDSNAEGDGSNSNKIFRPSTMVKHNSFKSFPNSSGLFKIHLRNDTLPAEPIQFATKVDKSAEFHGGSKAWSKYVSKVLTKHVDEFNESDYGTCIIRFAVDTKGEVCHVEAATMRGSKLAAVIEDALKKSPKWIPAEADGKAVNSYRILPVTLTNPKFQ